MKYRVVLTSRGKLDLYQAALWWAEHRDAQQAIEWLDKFEAAIAALADNPMSHPCAREDHQFEYTLHRLTYGFGKRPTHRALFEVRGDTVYVRAIRHLHQDDVTSDDLG